MRGHTDLERKNQNIGRKEKRFERNANTQKEQESLLEDDKEVQLVKVTA